MSEMSLALADKMKTKKSIFFREIIYLLSPGGPWHALCSVGLMI